MKKLHISILTIVSLILISSCTTTKQVTKNTDKPVKPDTTVKAGWVDPDTYTVKVVDASIPEAEDKAKLRILKDIVNVRVRNQSRYTDITKIKKEFKNLLAKGKTIHSKNVDGGVEIYYQIREKNLRSKFERK